MGEGFAVPRVGYLRIGCTLSQGVWPFVPLFQDSCRLAKMSFSFCGGMNGNFRDLLGIA